MQDRKPTHQEQLRLQCLAWGQVDTNKNQRPFDYYMATRATELFHLNIRVKLFSPICGLEFDDSHG